MQSTITPQQRFANIQAPDIQRSTFDRSHGNKLTLDAGLVIPIFVDEALPGDTFNLKATLFGRIGTLLKPIMDNVVADIHWFSVPLRLLQTNFRFMMGEQINPGDSTSYIAPTMTSTAGTGYLEESLYDYFGLPTKIPGLVHNTYALRAYNLTWKEWYRDENLQNSPVINSDDGPDTDTDYIVRTRQQRKDYFTSALPWAQKATAVSLPLGSTAPIILNPTSGALPNWKVRVSATGALVATGAGSDLSSQVNGAMQSSAASTNWSLDPNGGLAADLSAATAATINSIRLAFQTQRMYERDARGGTRLTEIIKSHFGIESPDARQQRPEFLGGSSTPINISPIAQNSATATEPTPQGNLSAMGTFNLSSSGFVKSFTEHEVVIGLLSIRADQNYQQGLNRMWSRSTRFDFYWPTFAHLGEQAILNKEIYAQGTANLTADAAAFGYQERYAEYRYKPSQITGLYRSNATASLDVWHLAQDYSALPALNAAFVALAPPIDRIVAVSSEPQFLVDCYFDFTAARPMPTYATPGLMDHF